MKLASLKITTTSKGYEMYEVQSPIQYKDVDDLISILKEKYIEKPNGSLQQFTGSIHAYNTWRVEDKILQLEFDKGKLIGIGRFTNLPKNNYDWRN
jgi:hypothetical protein